MASGGLGSFLYRDPALHAIPAQLQDTIPCVLRRVGPVASADCRQPAMHPASLQCTSDVAADNSVRPSRQSLSPRAAPHSRPVSCTGTGAGAGTGGLPAASSVGAAAAVAAPAANPPPIAVVSIREGTEEAQQRVWLAHEHGKATRTAFSLPAMLGVGGKRYIQVVDLMPAHMPPLEAYIEDAEDVDDQPVEPVNDRSRAAASPRNAADTSSSYDDGAQAQAPSASHSPKRPSLGTGAWGGRDVNEVVHAAQEFDLSRRVRFRRCCTRRHARLRTAAHDCALLHTEPRARISWCTWTACTHIMFVMRRCASGARRLTLRIRVWSLLFG